jgi:hypothetical protein
LINRGSTYWDFLPSWSPDGKTVLFNETNGPQALGWLMLFDYTNPQTAQAVHWRSGTVANHGSYSPDGLWLVYKAATFRSPCQVVNPGQWTSIRSGARSVHPKSHPHNYWESSWMWNQLKVLGWSSVTYVQDRRTMGDPRTADTRETAKRRWQWVPKN